MESTEETRERWGAATGFAALLVAAIAVAFERSTPNPNPTPDEVVAFYSDHRTELLAQSLLFVLSAGIFLWFLGSVRAHLARAERGNGRLTSIAYAAGLVWIVVNLAVQAPQIALARAADGDLSPDLATVMNELGLALATIADVPVAVLTIAVGVLSLRANAFPAWLGWLSMVVATAHLIAWTGVVADTGPLAPGGWATFVIYPVFVVWLLAVTSTMVAPRAGRTAAHLRQRSPDHDRE